MKHSFEVAESETQLDLNKIRGEVNAVLNTYFNDKIKHSNTFDDRFSKLWELIKDQANAGGKRLRPYFVILAYEAYGGKELENIMPVAAAQELLHISLLMHDDIIDEDYIRHGHTNLAGKMIADYTEHGGGNNAEHCGNSAALLAGDLLLSSAYQIILESKLTNSNKIQALSRLSEAIFFVGGGEFLDMESSILPTSIDQALKIADLKTARYSFVTPLVIGAELAGASHSQLLLLEEFGVALGIAFQLADDLLGTYGDSEITGKSILSDIREGRRTFLMLYAFKSATPTDKLFMEKHLGDPSLTIHQANEFKIILKKTGAKAETVKKLQLYAAQATKVLDTLSLPKNIKQIFVSIIEQSTKRTS